jgi:hypothetical protein
MPDEPLPRLRCPNCGTALVGPHCHACGLTNASRRLNLDEMAREAFDALLGIDGRLWRTLKELTLRPGDAIRAWVHGRRSLMVAPVRYYVGAVIGYLLVASVTGIPGVTEGQMPVGPGPVGEAAEAYLEFMATHMKLVILAFQPVLAVFMHVAFRRQGYDLAETLAFTLFTGGHTTLFSMTALVAWRDAGQVGMLIMAVVVMGAAILYLTWAARRFYGEHLPETFIKVLLAYCSWVGFFSLTLWAMVGVAMLLT